MNTLKLWRLREIAALLVVATVGTLAAGCNAVATTEVWARSAVGSPLAALATLAATPGSYPATHGGLKREDTTPDGGAWYRYPLQPWCDVLFEVDAQGVIRAWRAEGADC